ncbi:ANTAR domain-containing protein [Streptomyces populi]|jgi:hypothetical protein
MTDATQNARPRTGGGSVPEQNGKPHPGAGSWLEREDLSQWIDQLQQEIGQLHQAIDSHAVVDQAIGVVILLGGLSPEQGFDVLRTVSQHTNIKLREIAEQIVAWARNGQLLPDIRRALNSALQNTGPD